MHSHSETRSLGGVLVPAYGRIRPVLRDADAKRAEEFHADLEATCTRLRISDLTLTSQFDVACRRLAEATGGKAAHPHPHPHPYPHAVLVDLPVTPLPEDCYQYLLLGTPASPEEAGAAPHGYPVEAVESLGGGPATVRLPTRNLSTATTRSGTYRLRLCSLPAYVVVLLQDTHDNRAVVVDVAHLPSATAAFSVELDGARIRAWFLAGGWGRRPRSTRRRRSWGKTAS